MEDHKICLLIVTDNRNSGEQKVSNDFLDSRLGPIPPCLEAEKNKFTNKLLFSNNNKTFLSSQDGGGGSQGGYMKDVEVKWGYWVKGFAKEKVREVIVEEEEGE